jgi:hypothetical protein
MVESITIQNKATKEKLVMDKLNTADYILDYVDWGQASVEQQLSKYLRQIGATITQISFQTRPIEISGFVVADTEEEMTERKEFLNQFVNPQFEYLAIYKEFVIKFQPTLSVQYANVQESENNEVICRFRISGICPDPTFSLVSDLDVDITDATPVFMFPLIIDEEEPVIFGIRKPNTATKIINNGDIDIGFKFMLFATGEVVNPSASNFTTKEFFKLNVTMQKGDVIEVNTSIGSKSVLGGIQGDLENFFKYKTLDSSWLTLKKGENVLNFTADSGADNLMMVVEFTSKYLEVQQCY